MLNFHIVSIFPEILSSYSNESILKRAQKSKKIKINIYNPRDFSKDKHKKVDDKPYGGGPGMVMQIEPIVLAVKKILGKLKNNKNTKTIIFSPSGKKFTNIEAKKLSKYKNLILICGRYEGIDTRVKKILKADLVSIGDYILTGGEIPAMIVLDSVSRQISGVLGNENSIEEKRISSSEVYTRPEIFKYNGKEYKVPEILLSGNHKEIEEWKLKSSGRAF
ncbi:MAG: tRNA (guanosine(37)-N1)-methyltransferase TrmD [Candidatus Paceibacterota bacterium]